jgi:hypothetical protein
VLNNPLWTRENSPSSKLQTIFILAAVMLAVSVAIVNVLSPTYINADSYIMTVMSRQNLTVFYWGQNRYINLYPALTFPISSFRTNLFAEQVLTGISYVVCLLIIASMRVNRWKFFATAPSVADFSLALFIGIALWTSKGLHYLTVASLPHAPSFAFAVASVFLINRKESASQALGFTFLLLSLLLNPTTILLIAVMVLVSGYLANTKSTIRWATISGSAFLIASAVTKNFGAPNSHSTALYYKFSPSLHGLKRTCAGLIEITNIPVLIVLVALVIASAWKTGIHVRTFPWRPTLVAAVVGALWIVVFSANGWVAANQYLPRYFLPAELALIFIVLQAIRWSGALQYARILVPVVLFSVVALLWKAPVPMEAWAGTPSRDTVAAVKSFNSDPVIVAGNYWHIWPAVVMLNDAGIASFGVGQNSQPSWSQLRSKVGSAQSVAVLCFDTVDVCAEQVSSALDQDFTPKSIQELHEPASSYITMSRSN